MCFRKLVLIWHPWGRRHGERSSRSISDEHRTVASHPSGHAVLPKALCPYTTQREVSPPNMKTYLLRLAPPAHPRFKADRLSRPIFGRWLPLRQD